MYRSRELEELATLCGILYAAQKQKEKAITEVEEKEEELQEYKIEVKQIKKKKPLKKVKVKEYQIISVSAQ